MLIVTTEIKIPLSEIIFSYSRSSGPGGQNVNKVNSKALLRWSPELSPALPLEVLARLLQNYGHKLTSEGDILIVSDRFRDRLQNQRDCLEKLRALLLSVAQAPKPRKKTKKSRAVKRKNAKTKKLHSKKKSARREAINFDD